MFRASGFGLRVKGLVLRVQGSELWAYSGFGARAEGLGLMGSGLEDIGLRALVSGLRAWGLWLGDKGSGLRAWG